MESTREPSHMQWQGPGQRERRTNATRAERWTREEGRGHEDKDEPRRRGEDGELLGDGSKGGEKPKPQMMGWMPPWERGEGAEMTRVEQRRSQARANARMKKGTGGVGTQGNFYRDVALVGFGRGEKEEGERGKRDMSWLIASARLRLRLVVGGCCAVSDVCFVPHTLLSVTYPCVTHTAIAASPPFSSHKTLCFSSASHLVPLYLHVSFSPTAPPSLPRLDGRRLCNGEKSR